MTAIAEKVAEEGMPWSKFAEQFALGSVLLSRGGVLPALKARVSPRYFATSTNRAIYEAMLDLHDAGTPIENLTVLQQCERNGKAGFVGGLAGIAALTEQLPHLDSIETYADIIVELWQKREIIQACHTVACEAMEVSSDAEPLITKLSEQLRSIAETGLKSGPTSPRQILEAETQAVLEPHRGDQGFRTGLKRFDQLTGGCRAGQLLVAAARTGTGKTAFALGQASGGAACLANESRTVAYFSLEMPRSALMRRLLCSHARVDIARHRAGVLTSDERARLSAAVAEIDRLPLLIDDSAGADLAHIEAHCRRIKGEQGLGLVVVDYLQLLSSRSKAENRVQEVSRLSRGLKRIAMDLEVPVLALSQLSRAPEHRADPRPVLADLRESGSIEQDADIVMFIFREEVYKPDREDLRGLADLIVAKHRDGPTARLPLVFLPRFARFEERAMQSDGSSHAA